MNKTQRTKPIRVLIDGEALVMDHFSGVGHYILELLRALDKELANQDHFEVKLITYFKRVPKMKSYGFKNIGIIPSPFSLRISNGLKIRNKQPPLDMFFGKGIYIFPNFTSWPVARSKSISIIYDLSYERYPQFADKHNQAFLSSQVRKSTKRSDKIITISQYSKQEITNYYGTEPEKISILYPAVDQREFYRRPSRDIVAVKKKYGVKGDYIMFIGNLEPRKNLIHLLLAYEQLPKAVRKKYSLLLVGAKGWQDGEIFEVIKRLQAQGDNILLPSQYVVDEDRPALMSGASVFAYPSVYEGFGIPPLEAMACGLPVASADNSSLPEAVGSAAQSFDAMSVEEMSAAILKILESASLQKRLVQAGYEQVDKFSWEHSAQKLIALLEELS